ncbi:GNAT family N-acetyltransferase [Gallaecimonas sp. GXIMD4217]|uniref:GNAT family N-acetyltransferase n=1 Tax=Gallaecimonas sp. GXIMD4217 TaxID=3131927 RepID=UPI00311B1475
MQWSLKSFDELNASELYDLLALRNQVFVVEQQCPYQDLDGLDKEAWHLLAWQDERLVAYLRLIAPDRLMPAMVAIGRVVTAQDQRGTGLGHQLMARCLKACQSLWPGAGLYMSAQVHLQAFYGRHGFQARGEAYLEDDIPHIAMERSAS